MSRIIDERTILALGIIFILIPLTLEVSGFRFTDRFMPAKDLLNQSPIGEIIRQKKTVRKRAEYSSVFSPLAPGDSIFVGDRVLTGKDSSARITLSDGNVLELGPESLIRIEPVRSVGLGGIKRKLKITLESGTVKAAVRAQSAPVVVENSKGEVILEATPPPPPPTPVPSAMDSATNKSPDTGISEPQFSTVDLKTTTGNTDPAPVRELIHREEMKAKSEPKLITPQTEVTNTEDRPILSKLTLAVRPPPGQISFSPFPRDITLSDRIPVQEQKLRLEWKPLGYGMNGTYRISLNENGNQRTLETEKEFIEIAVPDLTSGKLEFKVTASLKNGELIHSKQELLQWKLPAPVLVTPKNGERIPQSSLLGRTKRLLLSWKEMPACMKFVVEVTGKANDPSPHNMVHETTENFIPVPLNGSNQWKWRVTCFYSLQTGVSSSPSEFTLYNDLTQ